jgi:hypothetical protein
MKSTPVMVGLLLVACSARGGNSDGASGKSAGTKDASVDTDAKTAGSGSGGNSASNAGGTESSGSDGKAGVGASADAGAGGVGGLEGGHGGQAGSGGTSTEGDDAGLPAEQCNSLQNNAREVTPQLLHVVPPSTAMGGMVASGMYHLTSQIGYASAGCTWALATCALTSVITVTSATSGTGEVVQDCATKADSRRFSFQYTINGSVWTQKATCVNPAAALTETKTPYTATPTELRIYETTSDPNCEVIEVYTKQ